MRKEAERWLRQAEADLKAARASLQAGSYEWACFQAQQSGEKALKALLYDKGYTTIVTHSLRELVQGAEALEPKLATLADAASYLDNFYLPTRYPNSLAGEKIPADYYERRDAEQCLSSAESILQSVKSSLSR